MNDVTQIFVLLLAFELKQFFCDYPIHPTFILRKFQSHSFQAFLLHSGVHGFLTFVICMALTTTEYPLAAMLSALDFFVDFALALFRSKSEFIGKFKPLDLDEFLSASRRDKMRHRLYWAFYGIDRIIHHVTYFAIIFILCQEGVVWMM